MKRKAKGNISSLLTDAEEAVGGPLEVIIANTDSPKRKNLAGILPRSNEFANIENGIIPFKSHSSSDYGSSNMDIRDAVILCQKAYYNFSIFRNTIDLMTEFSTSKIFFKNGSKKSRDFFEALFSKININSLQDKFFREYYRSGNVFIYRMIGEIEIEALKKMNQVYGLSVSKAETVTIPVKYIILNPADIKVGGNISFASAIYYKRISDYELERLKKPKTEEDKAVLNRLPKEIVSKIKNSSTLEVLLPLDKDEISAIFYKKQDYEPFSVPMGYPVLSDINWKTEMKKMDMAVMRTLNQVILLVTMGAEPEKGGVNQKHIEAIQRFFQNESVARVLVADYTTKAEWVIPDVASLLDPKKYAVVDRDIREGLNNLLINSEDKFANASVKIDVFVERLRQARQSFIEEFLLPEIIRISKELGLKNYPTPYFEDIELKDSLEYAKIYTRLAELGILTPSETLDCIEEGRLPSKEESLENQKEFRSHKDKGFYEPIVGGPFSQKKMQEDSLKSQQSLEKDKMALDDKKHSRELKHIAENPNIYKQPANPAAPKGRPSGTSSPKKPGKVGASESAFTSYSLSKIKDIMAVSSKLEQLTEEKVKSIYGVKDINENQRLLVDELCSIVRINESPEKWNDEKVIASYIKNLPDKNEETCKQIDDIRCEHDIDEFLATLLYHSKNV